MTKDKLMEHGHPIRVVAKRTGMSPHLIRMWERRYSAITPHRTETGRRLYTDDDIERLILLRRATLAGESIGQIARLNLDQLRSLVPINDKRASSGEIYRDGTSIDHHMNFCLQAMKDLDAAGLETRLLRASTSLGQRTFIDKLLYPLLELTGEMWADGRLKVAHEHLASAVVRSLLGSIYLSNTAGQSDPLLISTTPQGQLHEFGALMAAVTAAASGWRTLYIGPNLPAEEIAETANSRAAGGIALSIVYPPDDPNIPNELRKIEQMTNGYVPLLVGGRSASAYEDVLEEIDALRIGGLADLRKELEELKQTNQSPSFN